LVLLTCVWLVLKVAGFKSPAQRYRIWLLGLIVLSVLPLAPILIRRLPEIRQSNSALNFATEGPRKVVSLVAAPRIDEPILSTSSKEPFVSLIRKLAGPALIAVWSMGMLIALTRMVASQINLWALRSRAQPISPHELGLPVYDRRVRLRISDEVDSPLLCGICRPLIILPADIVEWTSALERQAMIQHEIAHIHRLDPLANLFQNAL